MDPEHSATLDPEMASSSSSSSGDEGVPMDYFAAYETMPCDASDLEDEEGLGLDYDRLVTEEGLAHLLRTAPLGSRLEPLATLLEVVERIAVMRPVDPTRIVDLDTLVLRPADLTIIGKVIEVFGPVTCPLYSVLCHPEHLQDGTLTVGQCFAYLPEQASLVRMEELRAQKITDAEGGEGGEDFYSDDEEEAAARRQRKPKRKVADLEPGEIEE